MLPSSRTVAMPLADADAERSGYRMQIARASITLTATIDASSVISTAKLLEFESEVEKRRRVKNSWQQGEGFKKSPLMVTPRTKRSKLQSNVRFG